MPSFHQMEKSASQTTSAPAFKRTVTQGSSHQLWQMGYQHLCLLTAKQQKGRQAIPFPRHGRLASIICPLFAFLQLKISILLCQPPAWGALLALAALFPADTESQNNLGWTCLFSRLSGKRAEDQCHSTALPWELRCAPGARQKV